MNFGFTEEQELLRTTARTFLQEHAPPTLARALLERPDLQIETLWSRMAELGWTGLCVPDSHGGAGLSPIELCIIIEELGRNLVPVPLLPHAIATLIALELGSEDQHRLLRGLAAGKTIGTVCSIDRANEAGSVVPEARERNQQVVLSGLLRFVPDAARAHLLIVPALVGDRPQFFAVPCASAGIAIRPLEALDALRPLYEVLLDEVTLPLDSMLGGGAVSSEQVDRVLDLALVVISAEMLGGAERCLEAAVRYATERIQFGKPIGVHQAIKHKCADMLFAIEAARSIVYYAAWAARERIAEAGLLASMAKSTSGDAYRRAAADNLQIHGGVGFTWDYDCHLYLRRARSDDAWLGGSNFHRERVARQLGFGAPAEVRTHSV